MPKLPQFFWILGPNHPSLCNAVRGNHVTVSLDTGSSTVWERRFMSSGSVVEEHNRLHCSWELVDIQNFPMEKGFVQSFIRLETEMGKSSRAHSFHNELAGSRTLHLQFSDNT